MDEPLSTNIGPQETPGAAALRADEPTRHFKTIFDHIIDGVVLVDPENKRVHLANPAFCRMLGYSAEEVQHMDIANIHPQESLPHVLAEFEKQMSQQQSLARNIPTRRKDGHLLYVDINAFPVTISTKMYLMGIFRDMTELKRAQEELEDYRHRMSRAEKLASAGTLSATVAHELMQPLTVIRLSLQNAMAELDTSTCSQAARDALGECLSGVSDAIAIVARFRNYARRSTGEIAGDVDLERIVAQTVRLLEEQACARKTTLTVEGLETLPIVQGRDKGLEQVCFALIDNAIQAADGRRDHTLTIKGQTTEDQVALWFEDDCGGMPPEILEKIFQPFFTTKPPGEGTGLGLCIVERILSSAGGKIYVESRPHQGSTFCVTLPIT